MMIAASTAGAEVQCSDARTASDMLSNDYGERVIFTGILEDGSGIVQIFALEGVSWSILIIDTDGRARLIGYGAGWIQRRHRPKGSAMKHDRTFSDISAYGSDAWCATTMGWSLDRFKRERPALEKIGFPKGRHHRRAHQQGRRSGVDQP